LIVCVCERLVVCLAMMKGVVAVLLAVAVACSAFYEKSEDVVELTDSNFAAKVIGSDYVWVVEFYAPWCGHCKAFAPEFARAAKNLHGIVHVGAVNCDNEKNVCGSFGIQGFPTVKIFPWSTVPVPNGEPGRIMKEPVDYNGQRSAASVAKAAIDMLPNFVHKVDAKTEEKFMSNNLGKVLLFTDKKSVPTLFKALALEYRNRLHFGWIKNTEEELVKEHKVEKFPTVLVQKKGEETFTAFDGKVNFDTLNAFLKEYAPAPRNMYAENQPSTEEEELVSAKPIDPTEYELKRITSADDWKVNCLNRAGVCAVAILDPYNYPDDLSRQEELLTKLAETYMGKLHLMWFAAREQPAVCETLGISNFPSLALVNPARTEKQKTRVSLFRGAFDDETISDYFDRFLMGGRGATVLDKKIEFNTVNPEDFLAPKDEGLDDDLDEVVTEKPKKEEL